MQIRNIFTNFIAVENLEIDNSPIEEFCYNKIKNDPRSEYNQCYIDFNEAQESVLRPLFETFQNKLDFLHEKFEFAENLRQEISGAWMNLNECRQTSAPHAHVRSFFSGVYYVKASEGSGNIEFMSPIAAHGYVIPAGCRKNNNEFNTNVWWEAPRAGKLILFPSWLIHYVRPNQDGGDRISIAFNSILK